jgi:hypothetical protein
MIVKIVDLITGKCIVHENVVSVETFTKPVPHLILTKQNNVFVSIDLTQGKRHIEIQTSPTK